MHSFYGGYVFKTIKIADMVQLLLLIGIAVCGIYYYVHPIERNKLKIKLYPVQAILERQALQCSEGAPEWLKHSIQSTTLTHHAPNNQIAYMSPEGELHHCESGYLGMPLLSDHVTAETRFRYASVSKLWTSDAVLDLIKQNKMQLDTPILKLLPNIPKPKDVRIEQITVGDLLLHRAGFNRTGLMGDEMFRYGQTPFCPSSLQRLAQTQLSFDPNTTYSYSNLGYCLLGEVVTAQTQTSFQSGIEKKYALAENGIQFLDNQRKVDEAKYLYVETSLTGYGNIYTAFDFPALASSAGLSGSASALALQVAKMIQKPQPNILSQPKLACDITKLRDCYGYAMFPYQQDANSLKVYFRDGTLLGASSLVVVDDKGGVVTLLASGQAALGQAQYDQTKMLIYQNLKQQYQ
ncbi:serine hydrolase domain-containing protein [Acinetobacter towneri]|uniref:serine hydrolase domain-containing protein n=1 Tax=Acinetobacter towneri TaxID=202956 RepID=UPI003A883CFF